MQRYFNNYLLLSLSTGLLAWLAWPPFFTSPLIFIAFVPLLLIEQKAFVEKERNFIYWAWLYLAFFIWNMATTWWIWYASAVGAVLALVLNAALMTLPWMGFHFTRKKLGDKWAYPALVFYWLAFEYLHLNWQVSWPWLTLGNAFATMHTWVQWYEYTGHLGGSLWILVLNILLFKLVTAKSKKTLISTLTVLLVPVIISVVIYILAGLDKFPDYKYRGPGISVVQPNIDPYTDKFGGKTPTEQLDIMLRLAEKSVNKNTQLVMFPETSLTEPMEESQLEQYDAIKRLREFCRNHKVKVLTGADTYYFFNRDEKPSATARLHPQSNLYYDAYNTALFIDSAGPIDIYHKSKLVPGVEILPYPQVFRSLERVFNLGGTSGSLGIQDSTEIFTVSEDLKIAPVICYESVYGSYVGSYVRQGATVINIITNDGWWRNTPGYRQHLLYAKLRAIETRRYVARSANTGISAFINDRGDITQESGWWVESFLNQNIIPKTNLTLYARTGDIIGIIGAIGTVILLIFAVVKSR